MKLQFEQDVTGANKYNVSPYLSHICAVQKKFKFEGRFRVHEVQKMLYCTLQYTKHCNSTETFGCFMMLLLFLNLPSSLRSLTSNIFQNLNKPTEKKSGLNRVVAFGH